MIEAIVSLTGCQLPRECDRVGELLHREHLQAFRDLGAIDELAVNVLTLLLGHGRFKAIGGDVQERSVASPGGILSGGAADKQERKEHLAHAQHSQVRRHHCQRSLGETGVLQQLIAQLPADVEELLLPPRRVRLGQIDPGAKLADQEVAELRLVPYVRVQRRRAGVQRIRDGPHRQTVVPDHPGCLKRCVHDPWPGDGRPATPCSRTDLVLPTGIRTPRRGDDCRPLLSGDRIARCSPACHAAILPLDKNIVRMEHCS